MKKIIFILMFVLTSQFNFSQGLSFDKWEKIEVTDEFGDKTGQFVTRTFGNGTFSNSATTNAKLIAKVSSEDDWVFISLYEYGRTPDAKLTYDASYGSLTVKFEDGTSENYKVIAFKSGGVGAKKGTKFYDLVNSGKSIKVKCLINESSFSQYGNSKYLFEFITK